MSRGKEQVVVGRQPQTDRQSVSARERPETETRETRKWDPEMGDRVRDGLIKELERRSRPCDRQKPSRTSGRRKVGTAQAADATADWLATRSCWDSGAWN